MEPDVKKVAILVSLLYPLLNALYYSAPKTTLIVKSDGVNTYTLFLSQSNLAFNGVASVSYGIKIVTKSLGSVGCVAVIDSDVVELPLIDVGSGLLLSVPSSASAVQCSGILENDETYLSKTIVIEGSVTINGVTSYSFREILGANVIYRGTINASWTQVVPSPIEVVRTPSTCPEVYVTLIAIRGNLTSNGRVITSGTTVSSIGFVRPCLGEVPVLSVSAFVSLPYYVITTLDPIFTPYSPQNNNSSVAFVGALTLVVYFIRNLKGKGKNIT